MSHMDKPLKELGVTSGIFYNEDLKKWTVSPNDENPDLRFPASIAIYDRMRRTDGQIAAVLRALRQPILGVPWDLTGNSVDQDIIDFVRTEIGLPAPGDSMIRRGSGQGVVFTEHLRNALLMLPLGFSAFEQVYEAGPPSSAQEGLKLPSTVLHLRKLGHRPATTISDIITDRDGGLIAIKQSVPDNEKGVTIPVENLVVYTLDREGADWSGTSILRSAYRDWMVKDKLIRLNAQIIERNGMGVPVIYHDGSPGSDTENQAKKVASDFRAGANASATLGKDQKLELVGVTGQTVDPLPTIQWHDQQMAKSAMAMFLDLGHDTGARSLGDTFLSMFLASLSAVADEIATTFTEHVIRDLVWHNFGEGTPYPTLTHGDLSSTMPLDIALLTRMVYANVVVADDKLEDFIRKSHGLPRADKETERVRVVGGASAAALSEPEAPDSIASPLDESYSPSHLDRMAEMITRLEALRGGTGHV